MGSIKLLVFFTVHTSKQAHTAKHRLAWHLIFHYFQSFFVSLDSTVLLQHCKLRPRIVLVVSHFFENSPIMYWCKTRTQVSTEIWIPWLFSKVGCCIDSSRTSPEVVASTPILWRFGRLFRHPSFRLMNFLRYVIGETSWFNTTNLVTSFSQIGHVSVEVSQMVWFSLWFHVRSTCVRPKSCRPSSIWIRYHPLSRSLSNLKHVFRLIKSLQTFISRYISSFKFSLENHHYVNSSRLDFLGSENLSIQHCWDLFAETTCIGPIRLQIDCFSLSQCLQYVPKGSVLALKSLTLSSVALLIWPVFQPSGLFQAKWITFLFFSRCGRTPCHCGTLK